MKGFQKLNHLWSLSFILFVFLFLMVMIKETSFVHGYDDDDDDENIINFFGIMRKWTNSHLDIDEDMRKMPFLQRQKTMFIRTDFPVFYLLLNMALTFIHIPIAIYDTITAWIPYFQSAGIIKIRPFVLLTGFTIGSFRFIRFLLWDQRTMRAFTQELEKVFFFRFFKDYYLIAIMTLLRHYYLLSRLLFISLDAILNLKWIRPIVTRINFPKYYWYSLWHLFMIPDFLLLLIDINPPIIGLLSNIVAIFFLVYDCCYRWNIIPTTILDSISNHFQQKKEN